MSPKVNTGTVRKLTPNERALDVALVSSDLQDAIEEHGRGRGLIPHHGKPRKLMGERPTTPPMKLVGTEQRR